jgi:hypothetical protein
MELEGEPAGNCGSGLSHVGADHPGIICGADRMLTTDSTFIRFDLAALRGVRNHNPVCCGF